MKIHLVRINNAPQEQKHTHLFILKIRNSKRICWDVVGVRKSVDWSLYLGCRTLALNGYHASPYYYDRYLSFIFVIIHSRLHKFVTLHTSYLVVVFSFSDFCSSKLPRPLPCSQGKSFVINGFWTRDNKAT